MDGSELDEIPFHSLCPNQDGIEVCLDEIEDISKIDYVIAYPERIKGSTEEKIKAISDNRHIYLHNLEKNGLILTKKREFSRDGNYLLF